jgi:hypothetical protein
VTEGSAFADGVWERARYHWTKPRLVRITVWIPTPSRPAAAGPTGPAAAEGDTWIKNSVTLTTRARRSWVRETASYCSLR